MSEPLHGEGAGVKYAFLKLSSVVRVWFGSKNESFFFFFGSYSVAEEMS